VCDEIVAVTQVQFEELFSSVSLSVIIELVCCCECEFGCW